MNNELVAILDYLERDRGLERDVLVRVIEESLVSAARKAVGPANDLKVKLDPKTGDLQATATLTVVEHVMHPDSEISFERARTKLPEAELGQQVEWEVTPSNFGRIAAQTAKQGIMQRLRQAEKDRVRDEFTDRIGDILYGVVTRYEQGEVVIDFGRAEGVLRHSGRVPSEDYQNGDHICCILTEVNVKRPGPILVVSRTDPELVKRLFEREVTEIAEGIVEIKAVAREPGFRSKIAVHSKEPKVDPVGACVGIRGSRVKTIVRELSGEKVDIIRWDADLRTYVANALQPAQIKSIQIDEANKQVRILVEPDQLSLAIGKRGQNARLTHKITGWKIDIKKVEEKKEASLEERISQAVNTLAALPGISRDIAQTLVNNGFLSTDGLREANLEDLTDIDGIDDEMAQAIKNSVSQ